MNTLFHKTKYLYQTALRNVDEAIAENLFSEDFTVVNPLPKPIPFGGEFVGFSGLRRYLDLMATHLKINRFTIENISVRENCAFITGSENSTFLNTQLSYEMDWIHILMFDSKERYVGLREYNDTARMIAAFREAAYGQMLSRRSSIPFR